MRVLTIFAISSVALAPCLALAQVSPPSSVGQPITPPGGASQPIAPHPPVIGGAASAPAAQAKPQAPVVNPLTDEDVSRLDGTAVYGADGNKIATVSTALMSPQNMKIDRLVVSAGGMFGIGAHRVALPVDQFRWETDKGGFVIAQTATQLKSLPEWHDTTQAMNDPAANVPNANPAGSRQP